MSIHSSLKTASGLNRHRNVLNRAERIAKMAEKDKFDMASGDPLGLPKTSHRKIITGSKTKKAKDADAAAS